LRSGWIRSGSEGEGPVRRVQSRQLLAQAFIGYYSRRIDIDDQFDVIPVFPKIIFHTGNKLFFGCSLPSRFVPIIDLSGDQYANYFQHNLANCITQIFASVFFLKNFIRLQLGL
jgi:hypothetical protein